MKGSWLLLTNSISLERDVWRLMSPIVPLIDQTNSANESLGVGMYAPLMGTFDIPTPINYLGSMSVGNSIMTVVSRTDPCILPSCHEPQVPLYAV